MKAIFHVSLFLAFVLGPDLVYAQWHGPDAPDSLSFQGRLTDPGGAPVDTTVPMTFKLYKNGTEVWTETQPAVVVTDGVFDVLLGSVTPLDTVAFNEAIDLGVTVGGNPEIIPRTPLAASAYALGMRGMYATWAEDGDDDGFNVIGGASHNSVSAGVIGATISGGGGTFNGTPRPNTVSGLFGTVGGGVLNTAGGQFATVGGGFNNIATGANATAAGGQNHVVTGPSAVVGGGSQNTASGSYATVPGGQRNAARGAVSFAAGFNARPDHEGSFVWADRSTLLTEDSVFTTGPNQFLIRAAGGVAVGTNSPRGMLTLRGPDEAIMGPSLVFLGNSSDQVESGRIRFLEGTIETNHRGAYIHYDGDGNRLYLGVHNESDTLIANDLNAISIRRQTGGVGIGTNNPVNQLSVSGIADFGERVGIGTNAPAASLAIRGPDEQVEGPMISFFGNSTDQVESGRIRFVEGGLENFRGGYIHYDGSANKLHIGAHNTNDTLATSDDDVITVVRASGLVGIQNEAPVHPLEVGNDDTNGNGAHVTATGVWTSASSRTFKEGFEEIDRATLLDRLASLPVTKWHYRGEGEVAHIGPVAEDFRDAFGLGHDERYITTVDAEGVALAAIQGLYRIVLAQQAEIDALKRHVTGAEQPACHECETP